MWTQITEVRWALGKSILLSVLGYILLPLFSILSSHGTVHWSNLHQRKPRTSDMISLIAPQTWIFILPHLSASPAPPQCPPTMPNHPFFLDFVLNLPLLSPSFFPSIWKLKVCLSHLKKCLSWHHVPSQLDSFSCAGKYGQSSTLNTALTHHPVTVQHTTRHFLP